MKCWHVNEVKNIGSRNISLMYRPIEFLVTRPLRHTRDLTTTTWLRGGCGICLFVPAPWSGVCRQTEKRKDWSKGVCYRRTKGYTGKTIPRQDWNLLPWPVTKCYRASFNSSAFSSNSSPHTWLLSLICEFIWVTRKDGFCNEPLHVTNNSNWGVFYLVVI